MLKIPLKEECWQFREFRSPELSSSLPPDPAVFRDVLSISHFPGQQLWSRCCYKINHPSLGALVSICSFADHLRTLVVGKMLNPILGQGFAATDIHLINSQGICECSTAYPRITQSNAVILFHVMLSSSNTTWKCAQLSESLGSRPEQPLMCCGSWTRASQCLNFLPQNTPILLGADQHFSRPAAGHGKQDLFPSLPPISWDPPIPTDSIFFSQDLPHSLHSQGHCEFSSDLHHFPPEILQ